MNFKKILNILIFLAILLNGSVCYSAHSVADIEHKQRQTHEKIKKLKWLESMETNKLYKNQQKLESAKTNLTSSKTKYISTQKELNDLESRLAKASSEYNGMNRTLSTHVKDIFKLKRKTMQILVDSKNINMLVDRIYYQKLLLKEDYEKMAQAKRKAVEINSLRNSIAMRKEHLERSIVSINSQQKSIEKAIAKNENMINRLRTDRISYEKAERELEKQSRSISSYINKTSKTYDVKVASGFIKPIQGRITSYFGPRVHPIFGSKSFHSGIDIAGPNLGAIRASNSGKVIYSGWYGGYGKVVIVEHGIVSGKPITTLYAHMNSIAVSNGQRINKGQILGYEGTTGYSTGPHCHFEVRVNGQPNNPLSYI